MKKSVLFIACALLSFAVYGQERTPVAKSDYAAAERFTPGKVKQMVYSLSVAPSWFENSNRFWYSYSTSDGTKWYIVDCDKRTRRELFDCDRMAAELTRITRDPYDGQNLPFKSLRLNLDETAFRFTVNSKVEEEDEFNRTTGKTEKVKKKYNFEYNIASGKLTLLEDYKPARPLAWGNVSPDGRHVVYTKDFNIWYMDWENYSKAMANEKDSTIVERQLTFDGEMFNGFGDYKRSSKDDLEKEREKKNRIEVSWSPDSKYFLARKWDYRDIKDLWVINHTARPRPTLESYRYQMPGEEGGVTHLYIYDILTDEMREIDTSGFKNQTVGIINDEGAERLRREDYSMAITQWLGSDTEFFFTRMSRDLKRLDICRVDVTTLTPEVIIEERFNTYLETRGMLLTDGPGSDIIHWSEEDGWAHLYLYGWDGKRKGQITGGPWHVDQIVEVDPALKVIYFTANGRDRELNPYYNFLYRVNFDGSGLRLLTPGNATHEVNMGKRRRYFVDNASRVDMAPVSKLYDVTGKPVMELHEADLSRLFEAGYKFPVPFRVKAADGVTDLYGAMYLPYNMDSTKTYPIVEYVYPGPQQEGVQYKYMEPRGTLDRLAQIGFVVVTVGNRGGHPSRSKWYHTYGYGNLRDYGLADKKAAAIQLADRYPFMDLSKVGITGHSGGGFMSTAAILQYPEFFKVAVSCAGNHDNSIYNRWWSEKHHGIEEKVDEKKQDTTFKYSVANNQQIAKNLQGRLLLVTGDVDNNVHPANTFLVIQELIKAGKRFDLMVLPGQDHSFGNMSDYFFWRMADYFSRYLIGDWQDTVDIPQLKE